MIEQQIQEVNQNFFSPHSLRLELLKNCPQTIPTLAQWMYDQWHSYDQSLTVEELMGSFSTRLNDDKLPIAFVVLRGDNPVGVVSLKKCPSQDFADLPEDSVWVGSLQVIPEERKQGIGSELLLLARKIATAFGFEKLYFYTSNPVNVKWYQARGAQVIDRRTIEPDNKITLMFIPLIDNS